LHIFQSIPINSCDTKVDHMMSDGQGQTSETSKSRPSP